MKARHWLAGLAAALVALGTLNATTARADVDLDVLLDFDVVIGDDGDYHDGWDRNDNRVFARVDDRGRLREHYFSDIASAFYVLHERYGDPVRMRELQVPEYGGRGMLDATQAWYFWDGERQARGGMPLILAFHDRRDAREMAYQWRGDVLDFAGLSARLRGWCGGGTQRIYWRGTERWDDRRWDDAWNRRWDGWRVDANNGWLHVILGGNGRWDRPGRPGRGNHAGHGHYDIPRPGRNDWQAGHDDHGRDRDRNWRERDEHRDRGRDRDDDRRWRDRDDRGRDRGERGRGNRERSRDRDRDDDRGRDRDNGRDRERDGDRGGSDVVKGTNDPQPQG